MGGGNDGRHGLDCISNQCGWGVCSLMCEALKKFGLTFSVVVSN